MQQMQQEGIHNMSSPEGKLIYSDSNNELMHARKNDALIFSTPWCLNALSGYINIEYQISSGIETDTPTPPTGTIDINGTSYNLVVKSSDNPRHPFMIIDSTATSDPLVQKSIKLIDVSKWISAFSYDSTNTYLTASFPITLHCTPGGVSPWEHRYFKPSMDAYDSNNNTHGIGYDYEHYPDEEASTFQISVIMNPNKSELIIDGYDYNGILCRLTN